MNAVLGTIGIIIIGIVLVVALSACELSGRIDEQERKDGR